MLVAVTAFNKGNEVNVFLAADGVHLLNVKKKR
jgi:predicted peroxiredoxin